MGSPVVAWKGNNDILPAAGGDADMVRVLGWHGG